MKMNPMQQAAINYLEYALPILRNKMQAMTVKELRIQARLDGFGVRGATTRKDFTQALERRLTAFAYDLSGYNKAQGYMPNALPQGELLRSTISS